VATYPPESGELAAEDTMPITRREWWSMTTATHQQNGQHWGNAKGNHGAQKPN